MPEEYDGKNEGKLWLAEKFICEEIPHLIDRENLRMSIRDYIESYVGKWAPWETESIMKTYDRYAYN